MSIRLNFYSIIILLYDFLYFRRYAILNEVWRLVADGVLNVKDIDSVMSDGLGMRYAFLGAFETAHLNAEGMANYCERYNKSIYDVSTCVRHINMKRNHFEWYSRNLNCFTGESNIR